MSDHQSYMPEVREIPGKSRRYVAKPFEVWYRVKPGYRWSFGHNWTRFGRYKDEATAEQVLRQKSADPYFEYEVRK